jgi:hypothetical protein
VGEKTCEKMGEKTGEKMGEKMDKKMDEKMVGKMGGKVGEGRWERKDAKARGRRLKSSHLLVWFVKCTVVTDSGPLAWEDGASFGPLVKS